MAYWAEADIMGVRGPVGNPGHLQIRDPVYPPTQHKLDGI